MKSKVIKAKNIVFVLFLIFGMLFSFEISFFVARATTNSISMNWYSNSNSVGYWASAPKVFFTNLSSSFNVSTYVNTAVSKWNDAGISSSITTANSNANIKYYGGTRSQLNSIGFTYDSSINGQTRWENYSTVATANSYYSVAKITSALSSICSEANSSLYNNIAIHEYGHALGWNGHTSTSVSGYTGTVMYAISTASNTTLKTSDKNQLLQVYNAMR